MNGIERSKKWFFEAVLPMLEKDFPQLLPRIAAGIAGRGSECFGFDDEISLDHDCGTGVSLWLTDEDEAQYGFALMRAYNALHKDDFPAKNSASKLGFQEHGVSRITDFYRRHLGFPKAPECWQEWFYTPEYAFAEAVNGEVFLDKAGIFSGIRAQIKAGFPEDVRKKKIAYCAVMMAQSGQYNFSRCLKHGEKGAAMLALDDFVRHGLRMIFLLNNRFMPYYKWSFRSASMLPQFSSTAIDLENLLTENSSNTEKIDTIEKISADIIAGLKAQKLSDASGNYLEDHAFAAASTIVNTQLRSMHIMEG